MRVSDELVERLGYALDACEFKTPYADVPSMLRRILEDVLLHVPEPHSARITRGHVVAAREAVRGLREVSEELAQIETEFGCGELEQARARIAELETKLEQARVGSDVAEAFVDAVREALPPDLLLEHDGYPHSAVQALVARIVELEKRLQRVREWRVFSEAPFPEIAALGRILDAKETP